ncbi:MAG TPA: PRC-barrel domain-containing protein [Thermomicrobiales bacterium]|nr:PRC-barrel domain-containing protein [Thermomicrobiales bacterium]
MDRAVVTHRRNVQATPRPDEAVPSELLQRRDDIVRYTRGGPVYATDGLVGHIRNVVVEEAAGTVAELIVNLRDGRDVVLPLDFVDHTAGSALFLAASRLQFGEVVARAPEFTKRGFLKANLKKLLTASSGLEHKEPRRAVSRIGEDFVETPAGTPARRSAGPSSDE